MKKCALVLQALLFSYLLTDVAFVAAQGSNVLVQDGDESIVIDPQTGNRIITYLGDDGSFKQVIWVPATKINPKVESEAVLPRGKQEGIRYRYKLVNGQSAGQPVAVVSLIASSVTERPPSAPKNWEGSARPNFDGDGVRVTWALERRTSTSQGMQPGRTLNGFEVESHDLPGVGIVQFHGSAPMLAFVDEGPGGTLGDFVEEHLDPNVNNVSRYAVVPAISIPDTFDGAVVLEDIQQHCQDLANLQLIEAVFAVQLDALFDAARNALALNNTVAAVAHLDELSDLIKHATRDSRSRTRSLRTLRSLRRGGANDGDWADKTASRDNPIVPVAASVLLFDIEFVAERIKGPRKRGRDAARERIRELLISVLQRLQSSGRMPTRQRWWQNR